MGPEGFRGFVTGAIVGTMAVVCLLAVGCSGEDSVPKLASEKPHAEDSPVKIELVSGRLGNRWQSCRKAEIPDSPGNGHLERAAGKSRSCVAPFRVFYIGHPIDWVHYNDYLEVNLPVLMTFDYPQRVKTALTESTYTRAIRDNYWVDSRGTKVAYTNGPLEALILDVDTLALEVVDKLQPIVCGGVDCIAAPQGTPGEQPVVWGAAVSPEGNTVALLSWDGSPGEWLSLYNVDTKALERLFLNTDIPEDDPNRCSSYLDHVAWNPDGTKLLTRWSQACYEKGKGWGSGKIIVYDVPAMRIEQTIDLGPDWAQENDSKPFHGWPKRDWNTAGDLIVTSYVHNLFPGTQFTSSVIDLSAEPGPRVTRLPSGEGAVGAIQPRFAPEGDQLGYWAADRVICVVPNARGETISERACYLLPDSDDTQFYGTLNEFDWLDNSRVVYTLLTSDCFEHDSPLFSLGTPDCLQRYISSLWIADLESRQARLLDKWESLGVYNLRVVAQPSPILSGE